jgi:hypothetical protein
MSGNILEWILLQLEIIKEVQKEDGQKMVDRDCVHGVIQDHMMQEDPANFPAQKKHVLIDL